MTMRCADCKFHDDNSRCRRYPPTFDNPCQWRDTRYGAGGGAGGAAYVEVTRTGKPPIRPNGIWPTTMAHDWCGEFIERQ